MAKAKNLTATVAPVAAAVASTAVQTSADAMPAANAVVVQLLATATANANTADRKAREAAAAAWHSDAFTGQPAAQRVESLRQLYKSELSNDVVRNMFSAALAVLAYARPVLVVASKLADLSGGRVQTEGLEVLAAGSAIPKDSEGRALPSRVFTNSDALDKLNKHQLIAAAKTAREELGTGRKEGAGRKPGSTNKSAAPQRAPFFDEFSAMMRDAAGITTLRRHAELCGFRLVAEERYQELLGIESDAKRAK